MNTYYKNNLRRGEWMLALVITAAVVVLHFFSMSVAGGLWRDEVVTANIALLPTWEDTIRAFFYDSFPSAFHLVIRTWAALGLPHGDTGLRALGLCMGLFLLASFWAASRMMGKNPPLLLLSLAALNPVVIRYGDSIRSYGFGIALMTLTTGLIWRFVEKPSWWRGLPAGVCAVASVQTLYQNAFFLLAVGLAGVAVSLRQRQYLKSVAILSIGFVAALSLLPYVKPIHDTQDAWLLFKYGLTFARCFGLLYQLAGHFFAVWLGVVIVAAVFGISRIFPKTPRGETDLSLFCGVALVLGGAGFGFFVKSSGLPTQVWYYIPVLCFTMVCCEGVFSRINFFTRNVTLVIALLAVMFSPSAYSALRWRQTNGDLVAAQVSKFSAAGDYIIINPWYCGVTFARYYTGAAKWATLPAIADYRFQRYDLIKEKFQTPNAVGPVLEQVETALRSGHRVWIVGGISPPPAGAAQPPDPPLAPNGPRGWLDAPYYAAWDQQLGWYLQHYAVKVTLYENDAASPIAINPFENLAVISFSGWSTNVPDAKP